MLFGRTILTSEGYWVQQEYAKDVPYDNARIGGRIGLSRDLTRRTSLTIGAGYSNRDFPDQGDDQDELRANFLASYRISRSLEFNWTVRFEKRIAQSTRGYEEWISGLQFRYTFWGAARSRGLAAQSAPPRIP